MEGRFISGYADGLNKPETPIDLKDDAAKEALDFLAQHSKTKQPFDKVAKLIEGVESQNGMELLSTVHWVVTQESNVALSAEELIERVHSWNTRKAAMKPAYILAAWERLSEQGWLQLKAQV
ncbi:hypothetical protein ACRN96_03350 [Shewanella oncorhynchi]|uniref:hypothetical protein n=1 Tax=Shewanella TaxID=22 RepID=UPI001F41C189|nr:hypothetical protein [Shewanella baltica]